MPKFKVRTTKSTLYEYVKKVRDGREVTLKAKLGRYTPTFLEKYEDAFVNHIKKLDNMLMPLTKQEFLQAAFKLAESFLIGSIRTVHRQGTTSTPNFYAQTSRHCVYEAF